MPATDLNPPAGRPPPTEDDPADWLRLQHTAGITLRSARPLLDMFGTPAALFGAGRDALRTRLPAPLADALCAAAPAVMQLELARLRAWAAMPGNQVLSQHHPAYPALLLEIPDPPLLLYVTGDAALLAAPALAVVGSRNASAQGQANAEQFSAALSGAGLTIVSGLALGIDAAAHRGGLRGAGGTVAVIGTGADLIYPPANTGLARAIAEQGCIVSEYALGTPPVPSNFPRRNRVISGLALGVLVVEAALRSGSLVTARLALEQNRDVFAIPGSIHSVLAKGCHGLIKQGAKLVETANDILSELQMAAGAAAGPLATPRAPRGTRWLLDALAHDPVGADQLALRTGLAPEQLMGPLLALELGGLIERLPGGLYQRRGR